MTQHNNQTLRSRLFAVINVLGNRLPVLEYDRLPDGLAFRILLGR